MYRLYLSSIAWLCLSFLPLFQLILLYSYLLYYTIFILYKQSKTKMCKLLSNIHISLK